MSSGDLLRGINEIMILCVLLDGESYGYEISRRIRDATREGYAMKETTLYSALTRLERSGLVSVRLGEESHGRQRAYLRLTDTGRVYYREQCAAWTQAQALIAPFIRTEGEAGGD